MVTSAENQVRDHAIQALYYMNQQRGRDIEAGQLTKSREKDEEPWGRRTLEFGYTGAGTSSDRKIHSGYVNSNMTVDMRGNSSVVNLFVSGCDIMGRNAVLLFAIKALVRWWSILWGL